MRNEQVTSAITNLVNQIRLSGYMECGNDVEAVKQFEADVSEALCIVLANQLVSSVKGCPTCMPKLIEDAGEVVSAVAEARAPAVRAALAAAGLVPTGGCGAGEPAEAAADPEPTPETPRH